MHGTECENSIKHMWYQTLKLQFKARKKKAKNYTAGVQTRGPRILLSPWSVVQGVFLIKRIS